MPEAIGRIRRAQRTRSAYAGAGAPAGDWRRAGSRAERATLIREALIRAAVEVVGEVGYAGASIALITQRASVAQGTFYNHFASRQDILDQLLPELGRRMLCHVRDRALGGADFAELEERSFRAFLEFQKQTPQFFRILNEAESFAPSGHRQHFGVVSRGYRRFLRQSLRKGEFPAYTEPELEVVVHILMAARSYLALRYTSDEGRSKDIPGRVVRTYMKFVLYGLQGRPPNRPEPVGAGLRRGN